MIKPTDKFHVRRLQRWDRKIVWYIADRETGCDVTQALWDQDDAHKRCRQMNAHWRERQRGGSQQVKTA